MDTTGGTTGADTTGADTTGGTTGADTTGGTTGADTTTGGDTTGGGGTTGAFFGPPFSPYDAGPRSEPPIDTSNGCTALVPIYSSQYGCVQCNSSSDCATGLVCDTNQDSNFNHRCVQCAHTSDCPAGEICNPGLYNPFLESDGTDTCSPDCRTNPSACSGFCEGDSGICPAATTFYEYTNNYQTFCQINPFNAGWCQSGSDCAGKIDGGGACAFGGNNNNLPGSEIEIYPLSSGFGICVACTMDGGGCANPDTICQMYSCPQAGPAGNCVFNCFLDAGACGVGSFCEDAGIVSYDGGPDGGILIAGGCVPGCQNAGNCGGSTPICVDGGCAQCGSSLDCPDWAPGCGVSTGCYTYPPITTPQCGVCATNSDCPGTEFCGSGECGSSQCMCYSDTVCPLDVPTCIGGSAGVGGVCGCTDNSQCPGGYLCETRPPYSTFNGAGCFQTLTCGSSAGGACIAQCATNADCATSFAGTPNLVCDTTTGFCVPCALDSDCAAAENPNLPASTPSCILYPNGINPNVYPQVNTGGGQCGCSDNSQCNGGYACYSAYAQLPNGTQAGPNGTCGAACSYANGIDSCTPQSPNQYQCNNNYYPPPFCNTFTGQCQACLDDYDCTGSNCNQPFCSNGTCIGCFTGDDCLTFPNNSCYFGNCNSYCYENSQCPTDGGYACITGPNYQTSCFVACVLGDDAGMGTVSDAGNPCPASAPLCLPNNTSPDPTAGVCGQCSDTIACSTMLDCPPPEFETDYCSNGACYGYCECCNFPP